MIKLQRVRFKWVLVVVFERGRSVIPYQLLDFESNVFINLLNFGWRGCIIIISGIKQFV